MEKAYCGRAKFVKTKYGELIALNICLSEIPRGDIKTGKNGKDYINLTVVEMKQPDDRGNTHTIYVNQYKPTGGGNGGGNGGGYGDGPESFDDDIPF
jgi:hypothetical protein